MADTNELEVMCPTCEKEHLSTHAYREKIDWKGILKEIRPLLIPTSGSVGEWLVLSWTKIFYSMYLESKGPEHEAQDYYWCSNCKSYHILCGKCKSYFCIGSNDPEWCKLYICSKCGNKMYYLPDYFSSIRPYYGV